MEKKCKKAGRRFEEWRTSLIRSERKLGDGTYLKAEVFLDPFADDDAKYITDIFLERYDDDNRLTERKLLEHTAFGNIWDAVNYCEAVDLGEIETTNE